jgi:hypothetical protein
VVVLILLGPDEQEEAAMETEEKVDTMLGDLIVALTEETSRFVHDEREMYKVVAYILSNMYKSGSISTSWH